MAFQLADKIFEDASAKIMQYYLKSEEYIGRTALEEGNVEKIISMAKERAIALKSDSGEVEKLLTEFKNNFSQHQNEWLQCVGWMEEEGFKKHYLREDIKKEVMKNVINYILDSDKLRAFSEEQKFHYAFADAISKTISPELSGAASRLGIKYRPVDEQFRTPECIPGFGLDDPKEKGFIYGPLTEFVKLLYAREYKAKGKLV